MSAGALLAAASELGETHSTGSRAI